MGFIDGLLLVLYVIAIVTALYILVKHRAYFHERFRKGVVSVFMLAMLFFLVAYTFKMIIVLLIRASAVFGFASLELSAWLLEGWTIAQIGTTGGLIVLAWLTWTGRYDQFVKLRNFDRKIEEDAKQDDQK
ncbi:hypothetical protein A3844_01585 [Paenibacillus helianthi]|uniref:DUF2304 domain-containing protein n=1 Tax=Paenibacillus helianthi TaxID=1349432 RepID=A0ABX3EUE8_9BACL|nr:hypothetical protein [Paenibacillus helianthi]OKP91832.1 hypothetical protein A3844_01585 [Paenibacillus helianthi]